MGMKSKRKGKRGELEAAKLLQRLGFTDARRTQQYNGEAGDSDVVCPDSLPDLFIEVKYGYGRDKIDVGTKGLYDACVFAESSAAPNPWCVLWRPGGCPAWRLTYKDSQKRLATVSGDPDIRMVLVELSSRTGTPTRF